MVCKKCHKEIPDGSIFCNWCGKKQETTKRKAHRRTKGNGTIRVDKRYKSQYIALAPRSAAGAGGEYIGAFATYAEAETAIANYYNQTHPDYYNYTLSQIYDLWSRSHFENLSSSGAQSYKSAYKYLAGIQNRKIRELKTADYQSCIDICAEKHGRAQCDKVKQICSQLCKFAMQNDVIDKNYAQFLKLPKPNSKSEKEVFTAEEITLLWQNSDDKRAQIILFMIYMGYRIGEVVRIKKSDINFDKNYIVGGIKSETGKNRVVPICNPRILEFVKEWYNQSETEMLINDTVEGLRDKTFYPMLAELCIIDPPTLKEYKNKQGKVYKREWVYNSRLTPHCTRHTFATLGKLSGVQPEDLQKLIGHASYETTADIYIHEDIETLQKAMSKLQNFSTE